MMRSRLAGEKRALGIDEHAVAGTEPLEQALDGGDLALAVAGAALHEGVRQAVADDVQARVPQQLALHDVAQHDAVTVGDEHRRQHGVADAGVAQEEQEGAPPHDLVAADGRAHGEDPFGAAEEAARPPALEAEVGTQIGAEDPARPCLRRRRAAAARPGAAAEPDDERGDDADHFTAEVEQREGQATQGRPASVATPPVDAGRDQDAQRQRRQQQDPHRGIERDHGDAPCPGEEPLARRHSRHRGHVAHRPANSARLRSRSSGWGPIQIANRAAAKSAPGMVPRARPLSDSSVPTPGR